MDDVKDMIRAVINGQHALKAELLEEISKHRKETQKGFEVVHEQLAKVNNRLDKQGAQLAFLEDAGPTEAGGVGTSGEEDLAISHCESILILSRNLVQ